MSLGTSYVRGAERLAQRINTIRTNTGVTLGSNVILELLLRRTEERFARQVDPDGVPWPGRMTHGTRGKVDKRSAGLPLLVRTGKLRDSIGIIRGFTPGQLGVATGAQGRIGIKDPRVAFYARMHQLGIGQERRRFLGIGALDVKAVDSLLRRAIIQPSGLR